MYEHDIIQLRDVLLCQAFLTDLLKVGYSFPEIIDGEGFKGAVPAMAGVVDGRK
eukprot:CAMPEP_0170181094 /NCGR_PEP_ID=MMETSP0040_2-20121228/23941_1 /TAXON_ID=641309 /ORGANISM="Lotharella oceanica, Strain CCMP622" /LENGTH=53 /DNA_ID=CAMNT_0010425989 /DNA_START=233 /DNA_END=394 /DNA_ORIENTATION=+